MEAVKLKDVKRGDFVRRKPDAKKTYIKGEYNRSFGKYSLEDFDDISREMFVKGSTTVYVSFTF